MLYVHVYVRISDKPKKPKRTRVRVRTYVHVYVHVYSEYLGLKVDDDDPGLRAVKPPSDSRTGVRDLEAVIIYFVQFCPPALYLCFVFDGSSNLQSTRGDIYVLEYDNINKL